MIELIWSFQWLNSVVNVKGSRSRKMSNRYISKCSTPRFERFCAKTILLPGLTSSKERILNFIELENTNYFHFLNHQRSPLKGRISLQVVIFPDWPNHLLANFFRRVTPPLSFAKRISSVSNQKWWLTGETRIWRFFWFQEPYFDMKAKVYK